MNRKDDHLTYALAQEIRKNDFDHVRFVHHSIPSIGIEDVEFDTYIGRHKSQVPIYINAMTGGSEKAKEVNLLLYHLAMNLGIPFALGSFSSGLKDHMLLDTYHVYKNDEVRPIIIANIGADKSVEDAKKTIELLEADVLQVHVNAPQEMVMPEGERDFTSWSEHIKQMVQELDVDVIVKEVGFGMSKETIEKLKKLGVKMIDVGGRGGTDFVNIENQRRTYKMAYLENYGLSTVESLLEAKDISNMRLYASGGVRHAFDVVKSLALGAEAVGLSRFFLELVSTKSLEESMIATKELLYEIKEIMVLLNAKNLNDLRHKDLIFDLELMNFLAQRK